MAIAKRKGLYVIKWIVNKTSLGLKSYNSRSKAEVDTVNYESKWVIVWKYELHNRETLE